MNNELDTISEFIGTEDGITHDITPIQESQDLVVHDDSVAVNVSDDYEQARKSMKATIKVGTDIIDNLAKLAEESESPRAYEVLANTLKTLTEMNKSLMDLHKNAKDLMNQPKVGPDTVHNTQYIFNGSTEELQKLLKKDV